MGGTRPHLGRALVATVLALGVGALSTACTSASDSATTASVATASAAPTLDAGQVVATLGAVPIPKPDTTIPVPVASAGRLQVLSMGNTVRAVLGAGAEARVTATGPVQAVTAPQPITQGVEPHTAGTISVRVVAGAKDVSLKVADLVCRDDTGAVVPLTAVGRRSLLVRAGTTGTAEVAGVFRSGAAQLTWQPGGHPLVLWDFTIELD